MFQDFDFRLLLMFNLVPEVVYKLHFFIQERFILQIDYDSIIEFVHNQLLDFGAFQLIQPH